MWPTNRAAPGPPPIGPETGPEHGWFPQRWPRPFPPEAEREGLHEARDDPPAVHDRHGPAQRRVVSLRRVHAHLVEEGPQDVLHADRVRRGRRGVLVGGAEHLPGLDPAA